MPAAEAAPPPRCSAGRVQAVEGEQEAPEDGTAPPCPGLPGNRMPCPLAAPVLLLLLLLLVLGLPVRAGRQPGARGDPVLLPESAGDVGVGPPTAPVAPARPCA
mgnify:CR=1 FL=1